MRCCCILAMLLAMCTPCLAAPEASADQPDSGAVLLLEEAARHSEKITTLSARFRQEKRMRILAQPLTSQGYMCVTRASATGGERLLWAYTSPAPSGFVYENGQGALWETSPANKRSASSQEAGVITAIVKHILAWIQIDSEVLRQTYRLERPEKDRPVLLLSPRRQSFFAKMEAVFTPSLDSLLQITFFEANGDTVRIMFSDTQINQPLPERCAQ